MNHFSTPPEHTWRQHVRLRRSSRARYARLKIHSSGQIELVLPSGMDERAVPGILEQHDGWVQRTLERLGRAQLPSRVEAPNHVQFPALGEHWQIQYLDDDGGRYGCRPQNDGLLRVSGGMSWQPAMIRWLARKGRQHLVPWLHQVSDEIGLPYRDATVRGQRSRWGSCSSRQQINLNYALLFLPPRLVRYLFIHELCHTRHMNHSARYWRLVERFEPDYRDLDKALRHGNRYVPDWLHAEEFHPAPSSS